MCNQRHTFTLSNWLQLFNKSRKSYDECFGNSAYQLLYCYQSEGGAVPHQMDLAEQARPSMTSWMQFSSQSRYHWQDRCSHCQLIWNVPAKFPMHLFTAEVQNGSKGVSTGFGEARPKQRKQPGGASCFKESGLKCWEMFSSQLEDSVCNESALWQRDSDMLRIFTPTLTFWPEWRCFYMVTSVHKVGAWC